MGEKNIFRKSLAATEKIFLPPLHINLGLIKQFVRALNEDETCFRYLCSTFLGISIKKIKAEIFDGPQIRQLIKDSHFASQITEKESASWTAIVLVIVQKEFLVNYKPTNYIELVSNMLRSFKDLGCNMTSKSIIFIIIWITFRETLVT